MALALGRRADAAAGHGGMLLIGGEAGIGKSRLLDELTVAAGGRTARAEAFAGDRQTPGLLLFGIASGLRDAGETASADRIRALLAAQEPGDGSGGSPAAGGAAERRLLVAELAEAVVAALRTPLLLRIEDLHWADQLTLDVLQRVAGELPSLPTLVVATYRAQEPDAEPEFTSWRLGLLAHRRAEELLLPRLGPDGTRRMLAAIDGDDPGDAEAERMHRAADGIPLHVEELAATGWDHVPDTIGDAVLARAARLTPAAAEALGAAAVIGREFDRALLAVVVHPDGEGTTAATEPLDSALDELIAQHFIVPTANGYDFRHALLRDAVYAALPSAERRRLHTRVLAEAPGLSDALLSMHSERAGLADDAYERSRRAAGRAAALSAHREAVDLYRRAERTVPSGTPAPERAELHRLLGAELAAADQNREAEQEFRRAVELYREAGDEVAAAAVVPSLVAARHLLGADYAARQAALRDAIGRISGVPGPGADHVRGLLLSALAAAAMLDRRLEEALAYADEARPLLPEGSADRLDLDTTRGAVLVFAGPGEAGWALLREGAEQAVAAHREAQAARAYRMLGSGSSVLLQYPRSEDWLRDGIAYTRRIERWNDAHYLQAHLGHVRWSVGDLAGAEELASRAWADGRGGITTEITALHVLGYTALARADLVTARLHLARAAELGERMRELQRLSPALWGLAEVALLDGDAAAAVALCERGRTESERAGDAAYLFPFAVTGTRALLASGDVTAARAWVHSVAELLRRRDLPGTGNAIVHAEGLLATRERRLSEAKELLSAAAAGWAERSRWWEGTRALLDLAEAARRTRSPAAASALVAEARAAAAPAGATALLTLADEADRRLADGVAPTVLSAREQEVARLVATGATNREIAEDLHIAPKTVATHIEHILAKLGASRRAEIAAWASVEHPA